MCGRIIIGAMLDVMLKPVEDIFGYFIVNHSSLLEVGKQWCSILFRHHAPKTTRGFNLPSCPAL
jgi:hypothetical protein